MSNIKKAKEELEFAKRDLIHYLGSGESDIIKECEEELIRKNKAYDILNKTKSRRFGSRWSSPRNHKDSFIFIPPPLD